MEQNKEQGGVAVRGEAVAELPTMRFRKKPVEIEAIQWTGNLECLDAFNIPELHQSLGSKNVGIPTLEGTMIAHVGDWIIKGVKGEFYPCKPEIFELTYVSARAADAPSEPSVRLDRDCELLTMAQVNAIRDTIKPGDGWSGDDWDFALANAVAANVKSRAADALDSQPDMRMVSMRLQQILDPKPGTLSAQWHAADALYWLTGDEGFVDRANKLQSERLAPPAASLPMVGCAMAKRVALEACPMR